jgi:transcriptional regulator
MIQGRQWPDRHRERRQPRPSQGHTRRAHPQGTHLGPRHGYAVANWIQDVTRGTLQVEEGALYHALHRLERNGWAASEWGVSEANRRAKYYTLTPAGRRQLVARTATWTRYAEAIFAALRTV